MATKKSPTAKKSPNAEFTCADCQFSYNHHNRGAEGKFILCNCKKSQYAKLLSMQACEEFKHLTN